MQSPDERLSKSVVSALNKLTCVLRSLDDKQIGRESEAAISRPENPIPEATRALSYIRDSLDTLIEQSNSQSKKTEAFQRKSLRVQWWLFGATAGAFVAAGVYAHIASEQKTIMDNTRDYQAN
jgi:hypothetical protein